MGLYNRSCWVEFFICVFKKKSIYDWDWGGIKNTDNNNNNNDNNIKIDRYCLICFSYKKIGTRILYILEEVFEVLYSFPLCFFFFFFFWKQHFFYYAVWSIILGGFINFFYQYFRVICNILAPWIFNDYSWGICDVFVTMIFYHSYIS